MFLSITFILEVKVNDTRCKFVETDMFCIPHAEQLEWHSFESISQMKFLPYNLKAVLVDNGNLRPLDLHSFEKNVLVHTPALQHLVIRETKVTYIPNLEHNSKLIHFNASHNAIERVNAFEFSGTNLYTLDLSHNRITFIHENAFNVRPHNSSTRLNLTRIYLNNNRLTRAQPEWFKNLLLLKEVDLRNNLIAVIGSRFLSDLMAMNHRTDNFIVTDGVIKRSDDTNDVDLL